MIQKQFQTFFNLETNKRMKIHEKKSIIEAIVTKKAVKSIENRKKRVKYGAQ